MEILVFLIMICSMMGFFAGVSLEPVRRFMHEAIAATGLLEFICIVSVVIYLLFA